MQKYVMTLIGILLLVLTIPVQAAGEVIDLPVGQSRLLELTQVKRVAVTDPDIAEVVVVSGGEVLINGVSPGVTTLHIWREENYQKYLLQVYRDHSFTAREISRIIDNPMVEIIQTQDTIILKGKVETEHQRKVAVEIAQSFASRVIDLLEVQEPQQVLMRAFVMEVNRQSLQDMGLEWGSMVRGVFQPDRLFFSQLNKNSLPTQSDLLAVQLKAMEEENLTQILAAPELMALSGEKADMLVGGEIPILKNNDVIWKPYGIILEIQPEVLVDGQIRVTLEPEVSTVDWENAIKVNGYEFPAFKTRRVKTTVTVKNGSTIVLGGLMNHDQTNEIKKVPFLGDLPIFGELFQSKKFRTGESELMVMVQTWVLNEKLLEKLPRRDFLGELKADWTENVGLEEVKPDGK